MKELTGKFTVGVIKTPDGGEVKVNREFPFAFREFDSYTEVCTSVDWPEKNLLALVNADEKASAKAAAYQRVIKDEIGELTPEQKRIIKRNQTVANLVAMGVPREIAEQQVDALLAASVEA